jgi:hypothetical protein
LAVEAARAICIANKIDPDKECYGMGNLKPKGWKGPAWAVQQKAAEAALAVFMTCKNEEKP